MTKKITLTIGIPAYNEELNIHKLIRDILNQSRRTYVLEKIIVSSDGSSDKTVEAVRTIRNKRVIVIDNSDRKGIARGLNQIIENTDSEILVTLDADIKIKDIHFIEKLIKPILVSGADLTSSAISELEPQSWVSKALAVSMKIKEEIFHSISNGNNLYTCHGLARGYSRRLYKSLSFPVSVGNDMYGYLFCISNGYHYEYAPKAVALYRLPEKLADHTKQSLRFFSSSSAQSLYFDAAVIDRATRIPLRSVLLCGVSIVKIMLSNPIEVASYCFIQAYVSAKSRKHEEKQTWDIAVSSKTL